MPYEPKTWAAKDVPMPADMKHIESQYDAATEDALVIDSVLPVNGFEPDQVDTSFGPAVEFADGYTRSIKWAFRWPFGTGGMGLELKLAASTANAGSFRIRDAYQVNGGAAVNVDVTVTPGNDTTLHTVNVGTVIAAGTLALGDLITVTLSRLGTDAADTHTGKLWLIHTRVKRVTA